jgi:hypothetical protein
MTSSALVQKLWNYCNILRDDALSYGDYPSAESIVSIDEGLRTSPKRIVKRSLIFGKQTRIMV